MAWWSKYPNQATPEQLHEIFADYNPRGMEDENRTQLGRILTRFGCVENLVANKRSVAKGFPPRTQPALVSGHRRSELLISMAPKSPVELRWVDEDLDGEKTLNLALNNPNAQGHFLPSLDEVLASLHKESLGATGFSEAQIQSMLGDDLPPGGGATTRLDEKKKVTCPECGTTFEPA
jgi:hypothetical protein